MRRSLPWIAAVGLLAGCVGDDAAKPSLHNKPIDTSVAKEPPVEVAARVDQIGRQLVGGSPFLGVDPTFHTLGRTEPEVCHPDGNGMFVTSGLIDRCKSDNEVAAVLAAELAKMVAERRASDRLARPEPIRPIPDGGNLNAGGAGSDLNQLGTQAVFDQKLASPGRSKPAAVEDTRKAAEGILKSAGFDPKALATVEPLLAEAARNNAVARYLGGSSARPRWSN